MRSRGKHWATTHSSEWIRRGRQERDHVYQGKDIKKRNEHEQFTKHTDPPTVNENPTWRKEKGVRCGNSWRPGGESESRSEFVGVQNRQSYCRVYINSLPSPLLWLEQYLLKQCRFIDLPSVAAQAKLDCGCSVINSETEAHDERREAMCRNTDAGVECELKCMQINRFTLSHARSDNQVLDFTHHGVINGPVHVSRKCSWSLRQPSISSRPRHSAANSPDEVIIIYHYYHFFTTLLNSQIFSSVFSLPFVCPISVYSLSLPPLIPTFVLPSCTFAPSFAVHRSPSVAAWGTAPADLP